MTKKKHSLSIYLIKEGVKKIEDMVKNVTTLQKSRIRVGRKAGILFYKQSPTRSPKWASIFESGIDVESLYNSNTSAVFLFKNSNRIFALAFGYGYALLNQESFEENFGLRIVLNVVDSEQIRSVDAQSLDAVPVQKRNQASRATVMGEFGINIEQDLVYAATGISKNELFGKQITGKDSIKISIPFEINDLPEILSGLIQNYNSDEYKENFGWIDNLSEVRDPSVLKELNSELIKKLNERDFSKSWLAMPDIIEWNDVSGFVYKNNKNKSDTLDNIDWESYLSFREENNSEGDLTITEDDLRKNYVVCMAASSDLEKYKWSIYKCIYIELSFDEKEFALTNGKWYRINADFLEELNNYILNIDVSEIDLPPYTDRRESEYNERLCANNGEYALMDMEDIHHGGGHSKIEFCDIYTLDKKIIHVKRYGGSSVLSHLFAQGLVSANLLLSDKRFREEVNQKLPDSHKISDENLKSSEFEVIYAIAHKTCRCGTKLPLFSKVNLKNCHSRLKLMGFRVTLCFIPVEDIIPSETIPEE